MRTAIALALSSLLLARSARAQDEEEVPPPPPPDYQEAVPPAPAPRAQPAPTAAQSAPTAAPDDAAPPSAAGVETHDGLQLRLGVGFGGITDSITVELPIVNDLEGKAGGGSLAFHLGIGGTLAKGLTLGGFLLSESVTDPAVEIEGSPIDSVEVGTLGMLGVFVDWYPNPRGTFHFGGGLGGATLKTSDTSGTRPQADDQPAGGGIVLLVGWDWWVADEWSMGVLGRILGVGLRGENVRHDVGALSILFSVVYQ